MNTPKLSVKRILVDRMNSSIVTSIGFAAAITMLCLVVAFGLSKQVAHKNRVIKEKKAAAKVLKSNTKAVDALVTSFTLFDQAPESLIGTKDNNSKLILDALPSKYDFPALATSLEKILIDGGYTIAGLSGVDNEESVSQQTSSEPVPVEMPFTLSVTGPYDKVKNLPADLERSIRPIVITSMEISGTNTEAKLTLDAKTYYQPGKNLESTTKDIQ